MRDVLRISNDLLTRENVYKMICFVMPCRAKRLDTSDFQEETLIFSEIFNGNTYKQRQIFFSDPLVKHLWQNFLIKDSPEIVTDYIRFVRTKTVDGDLHAYKLQLDLYRYEEQYGIQLLPKDPL